VRAVNLIPLDQRGGAARGAGRSQGAAYAVLAVVGGLALLALVYGMSARQVSSRKAKLVSLEAQVQHAQAAAVQLAPYASFQALREQRVDAVNRLVNSRFDWAHAFHEFGRVLPVTVSITSITGTIAPTTASGAAASASASSSTGASASGAGGSTGASASGGGTVTSATPPGSVPTLTLTGCAINQTSVALTLERLRLMDGVGAVSLQSSTKATGTGGGSGGGSGSCPAGYPAFNAQVTFDALPASSATAKPAKLSGGA
jgi:hypothetical protein